MRPRLPALLGVIAASAVIALYLSITFTDPAPRAPATTTAQAKPRPETPVAPADASAARSSVSRRPSRRPVPRDARWVDLLLVDEDDQPVVGASVAWHDPEAIVRIDADLGITCLEQSMLRGEPQQAAQRHGWTTIADQNGRARIAVGPGYRIAAASPTSAPRLYGQMSVPVVRDSYQLTLHRDDSVQVLVLDQNGQPCPNIPIRLLLLTDDRRLHYQYARSIDAISNEEGRARIRHLQMHRDSARKEGRYEFERLPAYVHLLLPGNDEPGTQFDLLDPPTDAVQVRMPVCGSVRLRAELPGIVVAPSDQMLLSAGTESKLNLIHPCRPGADGYAVYPNVPIGKKLTGHLFGYFGHRSTFAGPTHADQVVEGVITAPPNTTILTARLLDAQGEPMCRKKFRMEFPGKSRLSGAVTPTDSLGNTLIVIQNWQKQPIAFERACIKLQNHDNQVAKAWIGPIRTGPGITALGDVRMAREPIVAAGRLTHDGQAFVEPVRFWVQRQQAGVDGKPPTWLSVGMLACELDGEGGFEVRGDLPAGQYRIFPWGGNLRSHAGLSFQLGQRDLVLEVVRGHTLAVDLLLPDADIKNHLEIRLTRSGTKRGAGFEDEEPGLPADLSTSNERRGFATWQGLRAGTYDLTARLWGASKPLLTIDDITLPHPNGVPPIETLDLRALTQIITIEAALPNGKPLYQPGRVVPVDQLQRTTCQGFDLHERTTRLLLPAGEVALLALFPGLQPVPIRGHGPRFDAAFQSSSTVKLNVPQLKDKPQLRGLPFVSIEMELGPAKRHGGTCRTLYKSVPMAPLLSCVVTEKTMTGETLELPIGFGPHRLRAWLTHGDWRTEIQGVKPKLLTASNGEVDVTFDEAGWQAARKAFAEYAKKRVK